MIGLLSTGEDYLDELDEPRSPPSPDAGSDDCPPPVVRQRNKSQSPLHSDSKLLKQRRQHPSLNSPANSSFLDMTYWKR